MIISQPGSSRTVRIECPHLLQKLLDTIQVLFIVFLVVRIGELHAVDAIRKIRTDHIRRLQKLIEFGLRNLMSLTDDLIKMQSVIGISGVQNGFQLLYAFPIFLRRIKILLGQISLHILRNIRDGRRRMRPMQFIVHAVENDAFTGIIRIGQPMNRRILIIIDFLIGCSIGCKTRRCKRENN